MPVCGKFETLMMEVDVTIGKWLRREAERTGAKHNETHHLLLVPPIAAKETYATTDKNMET